LTGLELTLPYLVKEGIDRAVVPALQGTLASGQAVLSLSRLGVLYLGLLLLIFGLNYLLFYQLQWIGQTIMARIRRDLLRHLLSLPVPFLDSQPIGRFVTRATHDVAALNALYVTIAPVVFKDVLLILGISGILLTLNARLFGVLVLLVPALGALSYVFQKEVRQAYLDVRKHLARLNAFVQEHLSGLEVLQAFRAEPHSYRDFQRINQDLYGAYYRQIALFSLFRPTISFFPSLATALILWVGGGEVLRQTLTFGALVAFLDYVKKLFTPIQDLAEKFNIYQSALAASQRLHTLMRTPPERRGGRRPSPFRGRIEFDHVWFAYEDERWVLKDITFTLEPGEVFALVGPTGTGKSTLVALLLGFREPQRGEIRVDGVPLKEIDLAWWRSQIGWVSQESLLFEEDWTRNITLFTRFPEEEVDALIRRLDLRILDQQGLASGEKQMLSLARVFLFRRRILILDEATSHLDSLTEARLDRALDALFQGRTGLIIAHRLSTLKRAHRILVMDRGRIVEAGSHEALLQKDGLYAMYCRLHFGRLAV
ncbi:MAG: ABC transporter ATP-binding protein/permease, partial [Candidatus Hydrothermae bacterium]|nr:ABC transporter ATP-binding protein/permease [Candidatus Hydrothermae bacterium]